MEDYVALREWLSQLPCFEMNMRKSLYLCTIKDNESVPALQMLDLNSKISPSAIIVVMPDGSYKDFWHDVLDKSLPEISYGERLASYSASYIIY